MINRNVSQENLQRNSFLLLWAVWGGRERMWKWEETTRSQWPQRNTLWSSQSTSFLLSSFSRAFSPVCLFTLEDIKVWGFFLSLNAVLVVSSIWRSYYFTIILKCILPTQIFYPNIPEHIERLRYVLILTPVFLSLSFPNHIELFRDSIGSTLRCIQNLNIPFYWRQLSVRSAGATLLLLGCLCFGEYFVHALTSAL